MIAPIEEQIKERSKRAAMCAKAAGRMYHIADSLSVRGNDKEGYDIKCSTAIMSPTMTKAMAEYLRDSIKDNFQKLGERYEELAHAALALHNIDNPIAEKTELETEEE